MKQDTYSNLMPKAGFPLGGIGTGSITLHASGTLTEFEIFNRPAEGNKLPYSFFALHAAWGERKEARVLEAKRFPDFDRARGYHPQWVMGLPRFAQSAMEVAFPFARIRFSDASLPLSVTLEAFTPFIPLNEDDSGIPAVSFCYHVTNDATVPVKALVAASMPNIFNFQGFDCFENYLAQPGRENREVREEGLSGILMSGSGLPEDDLAYADNAILAADGSAPLRPLWHTGGWYDSVTDFWSHFSKGSLGPSTADASAKSAIGPQGYPVGSSGL